MVVYSQVMGFPLCTAIVYYIVALKTMNNLTMNRTVHSNIQLLLLQYYTTQYLLMEDNSTNRSIKLDGGILDGACLKNRHIYPKTKTNEDKKK